MHTMLYVDITTAASFNGIYTVFRQRFWQFLDIQRFSFTGMGEMRDVPSFLLCYRCFSATTLAPVATFLLGLFVAFVTATPGAAPQLRSIQ